MDALSSLITKRSRADKSNKGDRFDLLFDYIKVSICYHLVIFFLLVIAFLLLGRFSGLSVVEFVFFTLDF